MERIHSLILSLVQARHSFHCLTLSRKSSWDSPTKVFRYETWNDALYYYSSAISLWTNVFNIPDNKPVRNLFCAMDTLQHISLDSLESLCIMTVMSATHRVNWQMMFNSEGTVNRSVHSHENQMMHLIRDLFTKQFALESADYDDAFSHCTSQHQWSCTFCDFHSHSIQ